MKKLFLTLILALAALSLGAQQTPDSLRVSADSTSFTRRIFGVMPDNVTVQQPAQVLQALQAQTERNAGKMFYGFRIRIYYDHKQTARGESASCESRFRSLFPAYPCYRTYNNPNFKVTVGDFRTRTEAEKALRVIREYFADASIVKESFRYPSLDDAVPAVADTFLFYNPQF